MRSAFVGLTVHPAARRCQVVQHLNALALSVHSFSTPRGKGIPIPLFLFGRSVIDIRQPNVQNRGPVPSPMNAQNSA
jgi:hypothetical protein